MDPIIPVTLIACGVPLLAVFLIWRFAFKRSLRKLIFSFVGILVNRGAIVDPNAQIDPDANATLSTVMRERARRMDFEQAVEETRKPQPQQAIIPPEERGDWARDTSANGWPRVLDSETEGDSRPFRAVRLRTEYEQYEYQPPAEPSANADEATPAVPPDETS